MREGLDNKGGLACISQMQQKGLQLNVIYCIDQRMRNGLDDKGGLQLLDDVQLNNLLPIVITYLAVNAKGNQITTA